MKSVMCKVSKTCCGLVLQVGPWVFPLWGEVLPTPAVQQLMFYWIQPSISSTPSFITSNRSIFDQNSLCIASQQEKQGSPQVYQMNVLCQRSSLIFPNMTGKYVCSDTNEHGRCPVFSFSLLPIGSQTITKPTSSLIVQMIWTIKPPHFRSLYPLLPGDFNALVVSNVSMRQWMSHLALEPNKVNHQQWTMSGDHRLRPYGLPSWYVLPTNQMVIIWNVCGSNPYPGVWLVPSKS